MGRLFPVLLAGAALFAASSYQAEVSRWHSEREAKLRAADGWLSLAGLFWLKEGANPFGKDPSGEIVLPDGPMRAGVFHLQQGKVTVGVDGRTRELRPDSDGPEDILTVGRLSLLVIRRGDKFGIRVRDPESPARREFKGIESFPASESYRVTARWVDQPHKIPILNVLGQTADNDCPGYAVFRLHGQELKLYPILEEPDAEELFYIFRDQTSAKETYGAGRFLTSDMPKDGKVVLDFNKAYNPPCAFTPYATCPLPPPENRLPVRIEAGEKRYGH
jgi:uncharacterized protein (DUF1684 family)